MKHSQWNEYKKGERMKQRVKNISYLTKVVLPLNDFEANVAKEVRALPSNAEVIHLDIEVLEAGVAGTKLDVGLDSEAEFFGNDLDVATKNYYESARGTTTRDISKITTRLNQLSNQGQISVRVHYFMPSEYMFEF